MFGKLIRTGSTEVLSCTITEVDKESKDFTFLDINFRKAVYEECGILFYEFEGELYYPVSMEFRYIDNNILFLTEEIGVHNFYDLSELLKSSFKREEGRDVSFFAIIHKVTELPRFVIKMSNFIIEESNSKVVILDE